MIKQRVEAIWMINEAKCSLDDALRFINKDDPNMVKELLNQAINEINSIPKFLTNKEEENIKQ